MFAKLLVISTMVILVSSKPKPGYLEGTAAVVAAPTLDYSAGYAYDGGIELRSGLPYSAGLGYTAAPSLSYSTGYSLGYPGIARAIDYSGLGYIGGYGGLGYAAGYGGFAYTTTY